MILRTERSLEVVLLMLHVSVEDGEGDECANEKASEGSNR